MNSLFFKAQSKVLKYIYNHIYRANLGIFLD